MADELTADVQTTPETQAQATPTTPSAAPTPAETTSTPAAAAQQTTPETTPTPPAYESARDFAAKVLGYKADAYNDDESFLRAIVASEQTYRRQVEEARQREAYLYQQSQKPAPVTEKPDPLARYKAPEFNPAWLAMVTKDADGNLRLQPGADPAIIPKLHAYQNHQAEVAQQITRDPMGYFKDMIEHVAAEKAQALIQEQFQKVQGDQYVNTFLKDNSTWLLQADSQGRFVTNPATGQAMLSPAGERFLYYMREAEQYGVTHPVAQERYAMNGLRAELAAPAAQGNAAVAAGDKQKQALLQQMNRGNKSGSMTPVENGGPAVQNESLSLRDRLLKVFDQHGIKDSDFAAA